MTSLRPQSAAALGAPHVETVRIPVREGLTLTADVAGDPRARTVILLHGGAQNRRAWDTGLRALARDGFRAMALDMRGHGDSDWAPDGRYALEDWADDLKRLVERLVAQGSGPVALVGASRGGQSALLTGADLPALVACVVLVDVTPRTDDSGVAAIRAFMARSAAGFASVDEAGQALSTYMNRPPRAGSAGLARIMRRDPSGRWFWQWDPRMAAPQFVKPPTEEPLMEDAASRVRVPVLLIRAGRSELVRAQDVAQFQALTPQLEVVEIPDIGHMITGDSNDAFMPPVLAFLRRVLNDGRSSTRLPMQQNPSS
jgi:pimeloyl-ACP methyl ester carboxylesterase